MNIKKIANTTLKFIIHRLIEIIGVSIALVGILLLTSLISYSPNDPNFIFPENTEIQNFLGFQGSYISDLFFQSIGIISYLVSVTLFVTGINIFRSKDLFLIIENIFFSIFYCILGSIFFDLFHENAFELYINGNGGFIGQYLSQTFIGNIFNMQTSVSYYFLIILIIGFFLISINFNPKEFWNIVKKMINYLNRDKNKTYTDKSEIIDEYIPQEEIKNLIQEDLPFIKAEKFKENEKTKFIIPSLDLLKTPTKEERGNLNKEESSDPAFL